jgi:hypothetical protein
MFAYLGSASRAAQLSSDKLGSPWTANL